MQVTDYFSCDIELNQMTILTRFFLLFYCLESMFIYSLNLWHFLTADSGDNQTLLCLWYQIQVSQTSIKIWFPESQKRHQMVLYGPAGVLSLLSRTFSRFISEKGGNDDTQQALAFSEMIKMFINTDSSRWWNLSHTPAAATWKCLRDMTPCINPRRRQWGRWPPGPTCDKQYAIHHLSRAR